MSAAVVDIKTQSPSDAREWPEITPLRNHYESLPYPLDALPSITREAVTEVQGHVQAPTAMVAGCAVSSMSIAIQGFADVARDRHLTGPVSLFQLTMGDSGERKTTCQNAFGGGIEAYERQAAQDMAEEVKQYRSDIEIHNAKCQGVTASIKKNTTDGKPTGDLENQHRQLINTKPIEPKVPRLLLTDATPEALTHTLVKSWPCGAIVSDEGGAVFGGHGMSKDSVMRYLAALNTLWGGKTQATSRRTSESYGAINARLTFHTQIQGAALNDFIKRSGGLARGSGFFARFLICAPESTQGERKYKEPPTDTPALDKFNNRIHEILSAGNPLNELGELEPSMMQLSPEAKAEWVTFHDTVEHKLRAGGEFADLRDTASKVADNAVRLAAIFAYFETRTPATPVSLEHMRSGVAVATWHLYESQRFFAELAITNEQSDAANLNDWLVSYCNKNALQQLTKRNIQQLGPSPTRNVDRRDRALELLSNGGRVTLVKQGSADVVIVNPALLAGGAL